MVEKRKICLKFNEMIKKYWKACNTGAVNALSILKIESYFCASLQKYVTNCKQMKMTLDQKRNSV